MPLLQAAIKHAKQSPIRRERRLPYRTSMKTSVKMIRDLVKAGNVSEAQKKLPGAFKAIDTAAKKHIIHWKNAARKKSSLARLVSPKKE